MQFNSESSKKIIILVIAILIVLLTVFSTRTVYNKTYDECFEREAVALSGYHKDVCNNLIQKVDFYNELVRMTNERYYTKLRLVMNNTRHLTEESVSKLVEYYTETGSYDYDFYQFDDSLKLVNEFANTHISLSDEDIKKLVKDGELSTEDKCYISARVEDLYRVLACDREDDISSKIDYDLSKLCNYIIWNYDTGDVVDHNSEPNISADVSSLSLSDLQFIENVMINGISVKRVDIQGDVFLGISKTMYVEGYGNVLVAVYKEDGYSQREAFYCAACFAGFVCLFIICCLFLFFRLQKKWYIKDDNQESFYDEKKSLDINSYRIHLKSSVVVLVISFTAVSTLFFSVYNLMQIDRGIVESFQNLSLLNESYNKNQDTIYESAKEVGIRYVNDIADSMMLKFDYDTDKWLKEATYIMDADRICLYDKDGIVVNSSGMNKGYSLTKNENDAEYQLWELLNGSAENAAFYSEKEGGTFLATRRRDDVGIVEIVTSTHSIDALIQKTEFADLLKIQDYPDTDRYYYYRNKPEVVYVLEYGKQIEKTVSNAFPDVEEGKTVSGIMKLDGKSYLYVNSGSKDWVTIFAYPVSELLIAALECLIFTALIFCIIAAGMLCVFHKMEYTFSNVEETTSANVRDISEVSKKSVSYILAALTITVILMYLLQRNVITDNLVILQFFDSWECSFNYVSLIFGALELAITVGLVILIGLINSLLCKVLPPKGATIMSLLSNIIKVVIVADFFILALEQFGVNATAIAASLGLTGLALSIGSKDVVSDLVAGLFIAFEGQLQLGDYIEVGGFFGKIESLGIRTTKVKYYNKEMIVNNTNMKNVINYSRGMSSFFVSVILPIDTDVDNLRQVVDDANDRFISACDGNLYGKLKFLGVSKIDYFTIECKFLGMTLPNKTSACSSKCSTELVKVLQENGYCNYRMKIEESPEDN